MLRQKGRDIQRWSRQVGAQLCRRPERARLLLRAEPDVTDRGRQQLREVVDYSLQRGSRPDDAPGDHATGAIGIGGTALAAGKFPGAGAPG